MKCNLQAMKYMLETDVHFVQRLHEVSFFLWRIVQKFRHEMNFVSYSNSKIQIAKQLHGKTGKEICFNSSPSKPWK